MSVGNGKNVLISYIQNGEKWKENINKFKHTAIEKYRCV